MSLNKNAVDITNKRFGRLVAIKPTDKRVNRNVIWSCLCDCGKEVFQRVNTLNSGLVVSCGCYIKEINSKRMLDNNNPMWKGDNVSLVPLHQWIRRRKSKPEFCEFCSISKPYDLANISGKYRRDIDDFMWLCRSCHMKFDYKVGRRTLNEQSLRNLIHKLRNYNPL